MIPNKNLSVQGNDFLFILCKALFLDTKDIRVISDMCEETVDKNVESLMGSTLCEDLYDMLQLFGEEDFIKFIVPTIKDIEEAVPDKVKDYLGYYEEFIKKLL